MSVPSLFAESWQPDGFGFGLLTVSGDFFTINGTVEIIYDYGGGQYQRIVTAVAEGIFGGGGFTVTESGIPCGDIPGMPGVGVIVTANDLDSGKNTTQKYATPCPQ